MDPLTQGLLGGLAGHAVGSRRLGRAAAAIGFVAGLCPDADIFLPMLIELELPQTYHRHFTHALVAIPIGAAILTMALAVFWRGARERWKVVYATACAAWATHGPLDACTSYGTHLLWPFDSARTALDCLPIVDPLLTLGLLACFAYGVVRCRPGAGVVGLAALVLYAGLGFVQRARAEAAAERLVAQRGDAVERLRVTPLPLSLLGWRLLYATRDRYVADAIRVPFFGEPGVEVGASLPRPANGPRRGLLRAGDVALDRVSPGRDATRRYAELVDDWLLFCDGWTAPLPGRSDIWADLRFCKNAGFEALWGVEPKTNPATLRWISPLHRVESKEALELGRRLWSGDGFVAIEALR